MKRNTIQRSLTLEAVQKLKNHPTADEVYEEISAEHPTISKGTVYRNLNQLADSGEIRKMEIPSCPDHFDHCCHEHYHIRCLKCGRVFDIDMDYISDLEKSVKYAYGFAIKGYDLVFKGICPDCSQALENRADADAKDSVNNKEKEKCE